MSKLDKKAISKNFNEIFAYLLSLEMIKHDNQEILIEKLKVSVASLKKEILGEDGYKVSYEDIMEVLKDKLGNVEKLAWEDFDSDDLGLGKIENVDEYGGEGQGETWYKVFHFVEHNIYIRVDGHYQSYNGTEFYEGWGCCKHVKPEQKTITVYE